MLHKVKLGHFTVDETGRKRAAFTEVIVEADSGDGAAQAALDTHGRDLARPDGVDYEMKVGVCGVDQPTAEERAAWEAGRGLGVTVNDATGHSYEFAARRQDIENEAAQAAVAPTVAEARATYDKLLLPEAKPDRMAAARAAKAAKKAAAE